MVTGACLLLLSSQARAQQSFEDAEVCREDASSDESCDALSDEGGVAANGLPAPAPYELPGFLFALHLGPFFSFGGLGGAGVALDFQFKIHRNSYLGLQGGYQGGYQIAKKRQDSLLTGTLAYRHYFPQGKNAFSIAVGPELGYYLTGPENDRQGYDWISAGFRAAGAYHFFLGERTSIGVGAGFGLFHQFSEFHHRADDFTILSPELLISATF